MPGTKPIKSNSDGRNAHQQSKKSSIIPSSSGQILGTVSLYGSCRREELEELVAS